MAKPSEILSAKFAHRPTAGQARLFDLFDYFLTDDKQEKKTLLIKGFAGTGKTSVVAALVQALPFFKLKSLMMAPTGRAAKVMTSYAARTGFTIHKVIYKQVADPSSGAMQFEKAKNYYKQTVFIVDEASMLSDDFGQNLLQDLIDFVFQHPSNRLIMIGDVAQLPPVGSPNSPALDGDYLRRHYRLHVAETLLTEVMRQDALSGILYNATKLREELSKEVFQVQFQTKGFTDFFKMTGERLEDGLRYAYQKFGVEDTTIICRSNKQAVQFNEYIRRAIHYYESEIEVGDMLMIVRNNYFYMEDSERVGFLANGDFVEVMKIRNFEELYGFRFAKLELRLLDYPDEPHFEAKVILDCLHAATPALTQEQNRSLYHQVQEDYLDVADKKERIRLIKKDPYLNALQVKFAYALTCHKSQGGQWKAVFVEQGYLKDEMVDKEYLRWLYTAVTRASEELYLVNFNASFFGT